MIQVLKVTEIDDKTFLFFIDVRHMTYLSKGESDKALTEEKCTIQDSVNTRESNKANLEQFIWDFCTFEVYTDFLV